MTFDTSLLLQFIQSVQSVYVLTFDERVHYSDHYEIFTFWYYIKNEKHQKIAFFSSYAKMLLICHFYLSNNDL